MLKLDDAKTATLSAQYAGGNQFETEYMGDTQPLANGNAFVGWGSEPYFRSTAARASSCCEGRFPGPDLSYRETLEPWVGLPLTPPVGAARQAGGKTTVYASWNGATRVASWRVLGGLGRRWSEGGGERRQVWVRDSDPGASRLSELRGCRRWAPTVE